MKKNVRSIYFLIGFCYLILSQLNAQISNKQGLSTLSIHPSATLLTFGLPQNSNITNGFQQGVFTYAPFPFTALPINNSLNQQGKTTFYGLVGSFDLGINYAKLLRNNRIFKTEFGIYYTCAPNSYFINDKYHFFINGKESNIWQNTLSYSGLSLSASYTSKSRGRRAWGEARNYLEIGARTTNFLNKSANNFDEWIVNGQGFRIQNEVINQKSNMIFVEFGKTYWRPTNDMRSLNMGLRIGLPLANFVSSTYTGISNNQATGANTILENGAYIGFQLSYHLPIKTITQPFNVQKSDKIYCEMERKVTIKHQFKVKTSTITIEVFDHENEDGDIVSVCFNGQYLVEKHLLTHKPIVLSLKMVQNTKNVLTIFAHNTGKIGANTSAIRLTINGKQEEIILYADKKESEGIAFIVQ